MAIKENPAGDANANSAKLMRARENANKTSTLSGGAKRTYSADGSSYTDTDSSGRQIGGGIAGTENYTARSGSGGSSGSSGNSGSSSNSNLKRLIDNQYDQSLAAKVAALQKARDASISGYNQNISALPGEYQPLRNQADLKGAQNSRAITEQMAAQGNWRSGANQTAQTANAASTANAISGFDKQQQDAVDRLKQAIAQVRAGYESDVATTTADTEAQRLAALISQANNERSFGLQEAGLMGSYNGQSTLAAKAQALQKAIQEAQLTGSYNGQQTLQGKTADLQNQGLSLQNTYQSLVNQNYPAQQALVMAQAQASLTGTNLQNDYQKLVNTGYPEQQALAIAQAKANLVQTQKQTSLLGVKSGSTGSSSANLSALKYANELGSQQALAQSMQGIQNMANNGASRSEILKHINANAGDLQANGVPVQDLYNWASNSFTWDKNENGWWNTSDKNATAPSAPDEDPWYKFW